MHCPALMAHALATDVFGDLDGVGLDFVDVDVLADLVEDGGQPFLDACWTHTEQADSHCDAERLAGRWAAKEAVMKCLGHGIGDVDPTDIEIQTLPSGAPTVSLRGEAAVIARGRGLGGWRISITHERGWAGAIAVAHGRTNSPAPNHCPGGPNETECNG